MLPPPPISSTLFSENIYSLLPLFIPHFSIFPADIWKSRQRRPPFVFIYAQTNTQQSSQSPQMNDSSGKVLPHQNTTKRKYYSKQTPKNHHKEKFPDSSLTVRGYETEEEESEEEIEVARRHTRTPSIDRAQPP